MLSVCNVCVIPQSDLFTALPLIPNLPGHYNHIAVFANTVTVYVNASVPRRRVIKRLLLYMVL